MTAPKQPHVYIVILALIQLVTLAWASFTAPCIEIGFFLGSVVTALSASVYAWYNSNRMGQSGMLLIYCMIACAITLAVASVVYVANFSLLGGQHNAQTGILLGGLIALSTVAYIAVRNRKQYPASLAWGCLLTFCLAVGYGSFYINAIKLKYAAKIPVIFLRIGMVAFIIATLIAACIWYISRSTAPLKQKWAVPLRHAFAAGSFVVALSVTAFWFSASLDMLIRNYSPIRFIVMLKNTPFWPGDVTFVRLAMLDCSLWPGEIGSDPLKHLNINEYLKAIRPSGDKFSSVFDNKDDWNGAMGFDADGIGISWSSAKDSLTLKRVNSESSAGKIGLARGDRIMAVNGVQIRDLKADTNWRSLFGNGKMGSKVSLSLLTRSGKSRNVSIQVTINPQNPPENIILTTRNGNKVGYLYLEHFSTSQFKNITDHFKIFKNAGVRDLVLDLRYNSGGTMQKAEILASLIGGESVNGKLFIRWERSQRYEDNKKEYVFESSPESMGARRLVVLTTDDTCSASETVINGLRPYMPVYTVGSATCGKPYGVELIEFGDKTLAPVTARLLNSRGEGHYSSGIRADFKVKDDLTHQLGDPQEAMLKKALEVLEKDVFKIK